MDYIFELLREKRISADGEERLSKLVKIGTPQDFPKMFREAIDGEIEHQAYLAKAAARDFDIAQMKETSRKHIEQVEQQSKDWDDLVRLCGFLAMKFHRTLFDELMGTHGEKPAIEFFREYETRLKAENEKLIAAAAATGE